MKKVTKSAAKPVAKKGAKSAKPMPPMFGKKAPKGKCCK